MSLSTLQTANFPGKVGKHGLLGGGEPFPGRDRRSSVQWRV